MLRFIILAFRSVTYCLTYLGLVLCVFVNEKDRFILFVKTIVATILLRLFFLISRLLIQWESCFTECFSSSPLVTQKRLVPCRASNFGSRNLNIYVRLRVPVKHELSMLAQVFFNVNFVHMVNHDLHDHGQDKIHHEGTRDYRKKGPSHHRCLFMGCFANIVRRLNIRVNSLCFCWNFLPLALRGGVVPAYHYVIIINLFGWLERSLDFKRHWW